jgi:crossover junction endodeoxyribonuclease RuvC
MIVLGLDPGTLHTGWAVVEHAGRAERALDFGVVDIDGALEHPDRLGVLYDAVAAAIAAHRPDEVAVEMPVFAGNAQALLKLGRAQGVLMYAAVRHALPVSQYTPAEVKKAVVGNGNAAKEQVAFMVRALLKLPELPPPDAADALAVALCHGRRALRGPSAAGTAPAKDWKAFLAANPGRVRG